MAIDIRRFVDVNIKPHLTSAIEGTRKTVILFTNETNANTSAPIIVESYEQAEVSCVGMPNTLIYLNIFFNCKGASVKVIGGVASDAIDLSVLTNEEIIVAYAGDSINIGTIYSNMKALAIENEPNDAELGIHGVNEKIFLGRCTTINDTDSVENFAVKYSNVHGAEMTIAAYLSKINVYGTNTVYDYMFVSEGTTDSTSAFYLAESLSDNDYRDILDNNMNVDIYLAGAVRNCGGNLKDGQDLVNKYVLIILHQTLTERLVELLTQRIKNSVGLSKIYSVMSDELGNYLTNGYLTTDKIWTDEDLVINYNNQSFTIIEKGTAINLGYVVKVLPFSSLSSTDKTAHKTPPIYVVIADQYGIRAIQVNGEVI